MFQKIRYGLVFAAFLFVLVLFPGMSHAGGLGFAPLAAIAGIAGYVGFPRSKFKRLPVVAGALFVFLFWVFMTSFWSPYEDPQIINNPLKLLIGVGLYSGVFLLPYSLSPKFKLKFPFWLIVIACLTAGLLLFDQLTGYALTYFVDPLTDNVHPVHRGNTIYMNLSHSITVLALLTPLVITALLKTGQRGKIYAVLWFCVLILISILGKLAVGIVAGLASVLFMGLSRKKPDHVITWVIWLGMLAILFSPLVGYGMKYVSPEVKASISGSWEHRVEMWAYVSELISHQPLTGHGFDASRTFDETFHFRGYDNWSKVSLHPHNAGLHIWAETGAIGAALAASTLFFLGKFLKYKLMDYPDAQMAMAGFLGAALVICIFTYGVWQEWWWGILFLIGAFIPLAFMNSKLTNDDAS